MRLNSIYYSIYFTIRPELHSVTRIITVLEGEWRGGRQICLRDPKKFDLRP